jgi:hypothetical protein
MRARVQNFSVLLIILATGTFTSGDVATPNASPAGFERNRASLESAELIFVDATNDGSQESRFIEHFDRCQFHETPLIVFDDVGLWNRLAIWRGVRRPKQDMTSFGHWSGTRFIQGI